MSASIRILVSIFLAFLLPSGSAAQERTADDSKEPIEGETTKAEPSPPTSGDRESLDELTERMGKASTELHAVGATRGVLEMQQHVLADLDGLIARLEEEPGGS